MHYAGGGVLAHPVGRVVEAGDGDVLAVHLDRVACGIRRIRPSGVAVRIEAGAAVALGGDHRRCVFGQVEILRHHVLQNRLAAQGQGRAAGSLANLLENGVQIGRAAHGLVEVVRCLGPRIGHACRIGIVGGHIVHIVGDIAAGRAAEAADGVHGGTIPIILHSLAGTDGSVGNRVTEAVIMGSPSVNMTTTF